MNWKYVNTTIIIDEKTYIIKSEIIKQKEK